MVSEDNPTAYRPPGRWHDFWRHLLTDDENVHLFFTSPVLVMHLACLAVIWVGVSWTAVLLCLITYLLRVFALTAGFHRYFSHRSFKTSRVFQFVLAFLGTSSAQMGPIWWASHHRHHHKYADTEHDIHSPRRHGLWWAHVGWILCRKFEYIDEKRVQDLLKVPELRWIDRWYVVPPWILALSMLGLGTWLGRAYPGLGITGWQAVVWGFFVSTVLVYHVTFCINSVTHVFGSRRFQTKDDSRNSLVLALLTMGEGWHNNHHRYPGSVRQGFYWWEIDITYYLLKGLAALRLVRDLKAPPERIYEEARTGKKVRRQVTA